MLPRRKHRFLWKKIHHFFTIQLIIGDKKVEYGLIYWKCKKVTKATKFRFDLIWSHGRIISIDLLCYKVIINYNRNHYSCWWWWWQWWWWELPKYNFLKVESNASSGGMRSKESWKQMAALFANQKKQLWNSPSMLCNTSVNHLPSHYDDTLATIIGLTAHGKLHIRVLQIVDVVKSCCNEKYWKL